MREIILGIVAAIIVAVGAGIWLDQAQQSTAERNTAHNSVRI